MRYKWIITIFFHSKTCHYVWLPELQQGQVFGQVSLTILAALTTMPSNLYPQR